MDEEEAMALKVSFLGEKIASPKFLIVWLCVKAKRP
jgi:hypothetical protein